MNATVLLEVDAKHEAMLRRALVLVEEMEQLALTAPEGTDFEACEQAVLDNGRQLQGQMLGEAVTRRIEAAEKKGAPLRVCTSGRNKESCVAWA